MSPVISLIIPHYNHKQSLPRLLESVLSQNILGLEVIIVDDCSDESCADVVDTFTAKGLDIRLIEHTTRQYTKNARLTGVEASRAKIIAFADADDLLLGEGSLAYHLQMFMDAGADIVHFPVIFLDEQGKSSKLCEWERPLGATLQGPDIFKNFILRNAETSHIWSKLYSRSLWLKILPIARSSGVLRYNEDFYLTSLLYFHANSYIGSNRVGYGYRWVIKHTEKAVGRAATDYLMLQEVIPYIRERGCQIEICEAFANILQSRIQLNIERLCKHVHREHGISIPDSVLSASSEYIDKDTFIKILLMGLPLERIQYLEKENKLLRRGLGNTILRYLIKRFTKNG